MNKPRVYWVLIKPGAGEVGDGVLVAAERVDGRWLVPGEAREPSVGSELVEVVSGPLAVPEVEWEADRGKH